MEGSIISCRDTGPAWIVLVHVLRQPLHKAAAPPGIIVLGRFDLQVAFQKRVYAGKRSGLICSVLIIPLALAFRFIFPRTPQQGLLIAQARRHGQDSARVARILGCGASMLWAYRDGGHVDMAEKHVAIMLNNETFQVANDNSALRRLNHFE